TINCVSVHRVSKAKCDPYCRYQRERRFTPELSLQMVPPSIKKTRSHGTIVERIGLAKRPKPAKGLPFSSSRVGRQRPVRNSFDLLVGVWNGEAERPCGRRAAEQRDELAASHSITSSALYRSRRSLRLAQRRSGHRAVAWTQLGMFSNCGRSSGFAHLRRRLVNISSTGSMPSGLSRLPSVTKIIPGKPSRLAVNTRAPHLGQKF